MKNYMRLSRRLVSVTSVFLLAAISFLVFAVLQPHIALAQEETLATRIFNRIVERLCAAQEARGHRIILVDPSRCEAPVPPPQGGHLIVDKITQPSGNTKEFSILASGSGAITGGGSGTTTDATSKNYEVAAGIYSVSETVPAGWTQISNTCTEVSVAAGETETCTIVNAKLPTLTLIKTVTNDNGGTATTTDFQANIDGSSVPWGVPQTVSIGAHTASETTLASYTASSWSGDCATNGTIVLAAGENKTCSIINDDNPPQVQGKLLITEVLYDTGPGQGSEPGNEWVEIHNGMSTNVNLSGYFIHDASSTDPLPAIVLPAGKFGVITGSTTTPSFWSIPGDAVLILLSNASIGNGLGNTSDAVWLTNPASTTIDAVSWGTNTSGFSPAAPDVAAGHSLARTPITTDTDTAADWADDATPTPGS